MAELSAMEAKVWLLRLKSSQGVRGSLSLNVIREICSYFEDRLVLYQVNCDFIRAFDCKTSTWGPKVTLRSQIHVDRGSIWVVLKGGSSLQWR